MATQGATDGNDPVQFRSLEVAGADLAYLSMGEGPLVLLLHGYPDTARGWLPVMRRLADAGYRAVAPNLPGYAPSAPAPDRDSAVAKQEARQLAGQALGSLKKSWKRSSEHSLRAPPHEAVSRARGLA